MSLTPTGVTRQVAAPEKVESKVYTFSRAKASASEALRWNVALPTTFVM